MVMTEGELAQLRKDQEALLPDTCKVTRAGAQGALNEGTGTYAPAAPTMLYEGACRVMPSNEDERRLVFGEEAVDITAFTVTFPHDAPEFKAEDVIEVTVSSDPQLVGDDLTVKHVVVSSLMSVRRVIAEVAT